MKFDPLNAITDLSIEMSNDKYRYRERDIDIYSKVFPSQLRDAMSTVCPWFA